MNPIPVPTTNTMAILDTNVFLDIYSCHDATRDLRHPLPNEGDRCDRRTPRRLQARARPRVVVAGRALQQDERDDLQPAC